GNVPDVDGDGSRGSYTVDDPLLERAKKLGLNRKGEFADLVQKQCSSGSEFKLSFPQRVGAGKGAAFMTKQNAFGQVLRQRSAVDGDKVAPSPFASLVDRSRDQLLARAGVSED